MKPISVEFQAFGPYEKKEFIDFEKLSKDGLFLIDGKTGSGKTMILDAITFALYGKSSGSTRDDLEQLRCSHCNPSDDTYVRFTFEEKGIRYIFERRLSLARVQLHEHYSCLRINKDGIEEPLFENCKSKDMDKKAEELIGLSYDQFRQVIILPQGKFEKLLTSDSKDKEAILVSIFDAGKWQKIADKYFEKAKAKKDELNAIKVKVENSLKEDGCSDLAELKKKADDLEDEMKAEEDAFNKADYSNRKKALTDQKALAEKFDTLDKYDKALKDLKAEEKDVKEDEKTLELAEKAENLRKPFEALEEANNASDTRKEEKKDAEKELKDAKKALKDAQDAVDSHKKNEKEYEKNKKTKTELEVKESVYKSIADLEDNLKQAEKDKKSISKEEKEFEDVLKAATDALNKAAVDLENAEDSERNIRESYMSGIKGYIAKELKEGVPCPVCGNVHHPKPAAIPEGCAEAKDVEKAEKDTKEKKSAWNKADKARQAAEKELNDKKAEAAKAETEYEKAKKDVDNAKKSLVAGIDSLDAFNRELKRLSKEIEKYEVEKEGLEKDLEEAKKVLASAEQADKNAEKELKKANDAVAKAKETLTEELLKTTFESEKAAEDAMLDAAEMNDLRDSIKEYHTRLDEYEKLKKELEKKLKGIARPDSKAIDKELNDIEDAETKYNTQHGQKSEQHKHLSKKYKDLSKDFKEYEKELPNADSNFTFAKLLRGDTGVGLQRYVLGIMFSSVIKAANEMLKNVAGGRYTLFRTSEKSDSGNKRGLDLKVMDNCGGSKEGRSVSTLSGGEKFLASLALSIGLAGIAKTGGVDIEGIFIDEGFGTLDEDCIGDALDILKGVQKKNGLVGIISHVELLRTTIYPQLQVKVDENKASHIEYA